MKPKNNDVIPVDDDDDSEEDYYNDDSADDVMVYISSCSNCSDDDHIDEEEVDGSFFDDQITVPNRSKEAHTVLKEANIRDRQDQDIDSVSIILSVPRPVSIILLTRYRWSPSEVNDAWFSDEEGVRRELGLLQGPLVKKTREKLLTCGICFDTCPPENISYASVGDNFSKCNHPFCNTCWREYMSTSINSGPGCLMLKCPEPSCRAAIGQDMIYRLIPDGDRDKYARFLVRSYVEGHVKTKWCPAPACEYAVEFDSTGGGASGNNHDVICRCGYGFCWKCVEEAHRPVDCETVAKWILKNSAESQNVTWILAYTKPCPKCHRAIEKNDGCMHMTCREPCRFQFCWLCLQPWSGHACNRFNNRSDKDADEAEKQRANAKKSLEIYTHYYERWAANHKSRQKAIADLQNVQEVELEKLSLKQSQPVTQLKFITDAWVQIIECRRVLKWTYAYGYYFPEQEHAKKLLFEYLQGEAETGLERLHQCAEKELGGYLNTNNNASNGAPPSDDFNSFRIKLTGLTTVTRNYFENLVKALENGLADVDSSKGDCSKKENLVRDEDARKRLREQHARLIQQARSAKQRRRNGAS